MAVVTSYKYGAADIIIDDEYCKDAAFEESQKLFDKAMATAWRTVANQSDNKLSD